MPTLNNDHLEALRAHFPAPIALDFFNALSQNLAKTPVLLDSTAVDAGNSPTTTLRDKLGLGVVTSSGKAVAYDPDETLGQQIAAGVLCGPVPVSGDTPAFMLAGGVLKEADLLGLDIRAKQQLSRRIITEDSYLYDAPMLCPRGVKRVSTNQVLTAADHGLLFVATAAVAFTLPTKQNGLAFRFFQTANNDLTVQDGDNTLIARNNAAAASVAFSTSSQKIGASCLVECCYVDVDTLAWIFTSLCNHTITVS